MTQQEEQHKQQISDNNGLDHALFHMNPLGLHMVKLAELLQNQITDDLVSKGGLKSVPLFINPPFIHPEKFAELIGVSKGVVGGWIDRGYLPTIKVGRYNFVNLAKIQESSKKADFVGGSIQ